MASKSNSTSPVAESRDNESVIAKPTPFKMMLSDMARIATADESEGRFSGDDLNSILSAETLDEMFEADDRPPLNFQHLAGCEINILDFDVKFSRSADTRIETLFVAPDGRKMYILASCVRVRKGGDKEKIIRLPEVGEVFSANTSARYVVAKLWRAYQLGAINPEQGRVLHAVVQEIDLGGDQAVLKLRAPSPASVTATAESVA